MIVCICANVTQADIIGSTKSLKELGVAQCCGRCAEEAQKAMGARPVVTSVFHRDELGRYAKTGKRFARLVPFRI